jgi:thioredoxin-related protein
MKILPIVVLFVFSSILVEAQQEKGIKFETALSWAQLKEKAKKENKYIFLDAFTTWCGPCKMMSKEIFPQDSVGQFFNKNFINVAVQFDVTKKDNQEVKNWYKDASALEKKYKIQSYPTYLFFNPQGQLVHSLFGASQTAAEFITKSRVALDPKTQYSSLKKQYEAGNKDPDFLKSMFTSAISNHDRKLVPEIASQYFASQKDLLSPDNLRLLAIATSKISDPGFAIFRNHADRADAVIDKGESLKIVKTIIFDDVVLPLIRVNGKKVYDSSGFMYYYSGELIKNVDWNNIKAILDKQYPELSEKLIISSKLTYLEFAENWVEMNKLIYTYLQADNNSIDQNQLNALANRIYLLTDDRNILRETINWSKFKLDNIPDKTEKLNFMVIYANLLNKSGQKEEAIKQLTNAVELTSGKEAYFIDLLEEIKKGK